MIRRPLPCGGDLGSKGCCPNSRDFGSTVPARSPPMVRESGIVRNSVVLGEKMAAGTGGGSRTVTCLYSFPGRCELSRKGASKD